MSALSRRPESLRPLLMSVAYGVFALCCAPMASAVLLLHFDPNDTRTTFQNGYEDNRYGTAPAVNPGDPVGWIMDTRVPSSPTPDPDNGPDTYIDGQQGVARPVLASHPTAGNVIEFLEGNGNLLTFDPGPNALADGWGENMDTNTATVLVAANTANFGAGADYLFDFRDDAAIGGGSNESDGLALRYDHSTGVLEGMVKQEVVASVPVDTGKWFTASLVWDGPNTTATLSVETLAGVTSDSGTASDVALDVDRSRWGADSNNSNGYVGFMGDYMVYNDVDDHSADFTALGAQYLITVPELIVNRNTGEISISVPGGGSAVTNVVGYSITSEAQTLDPTFWTSIADNYDADHPGANQVDPDNNWTKLSDSALRTDLTEMEFEQNGGSSNGADFLPGTSTSLGNAWIQYFEEDIEASIVFDNGSVMPLNVVFTGNGGEPLTFGDLDFDGDVDQDDFTNEFLPNYGADTSVMSSDPQRYGLGDLNVDGTVNLQDFILLNNAYAAANPGAGALQFAGSQVPEPSTCVMLTLFAGVLLFGKSRLLQVKTRNSFAISALLFVVCLGVAANSARAELVVYLDPNVLESQFSDGSTSGGTVPAQIGDTVGFISDVRAENYGAAGAGDGFVDLEGSASNLAVRPPIVAHPTLGTVWAPTANGSMLGRTGASANTDGIGTNFDTNTITAIVAGQISSAGSGTGYFFDFRDDAPTGGGSNAVDGFALRYNYSNGMLEGIAKQSTNAAVPVGLDEWFIASYTWNGAAATATLNVETVTGATLSNTAAAETAALAPDRWRVIADSSGSGGRIYGQMGDLLLYNDTDDHSDVADGLADDYLKALEISINRNNGTATLTNDTGVDYVLDAYTISSEMGSINSGSYTSLDGQNYDGGAWTQLDADPTLVSEGAFSLTGSTIPDGASIPLGTLFNTSVGVEDLELSLHLYGDSEGTFQKARVVFFDGPGGLAGDFNGDNKVDIADYTVWRNNLGAADESAINGAGDGLNGVDAGDYQVWKEHFGDSISPLAAANGAAVPEPASIAIIAISAMGLLVVKSPRWRKGLGKGAALVVLFVLTCNVAHATKNDRQYLFGDPGSTDVSFGASISEGAAMGFVFGANTVTGDDAYDGTGSGQDLIVNGATYTSVSTRPGAGANDFGANFDGASYLHTPTSLNLPNNFWKNTDFFDPQSGQFFPLNYSGINAHGIQLWAQPDPTALSAGVRQDVVIDTSEQGIFISSEGTWGLQFDGGGASDVAVADTVDANGWVHVMQVGGAVDFEGGHSAQKGILYVNGIAVKSTDQYQLPEINSDSLSVGSNLAGDDGFYTGVLDNIEIFLWGDNSYHLGEDGVAGGSNGMSGLNADGQDWGSFSLLEDNDYIASAITNLGIGTLSDGDVDLDGTVDADDIAAFQSYWGSTNLVDNEPTGDWGTRQQGDLNLDGLTDVYDAIILRDELLLAGFGNISLDAIVGGTTVPEPSSVLVLLLGTVLGLVTLNRSNRGSRSRDA
ncbi:hypothetical protein NG895_10150 [Aeoliella sp. ICT_H6.2]|uniref:Uncharacterized protein n=1 Tax=Aeoliella straminimaris TaxID=2954799 RepID=A0A9X2F9T4_9BACT|nr:LamG-like jellyroll fold domain-containing protein [Aeoliella straminimaris]MCO6044268.1 hypothetical protein [Aeoliella straminimaris]